MGFMAKNRNKGFSLIEVIIGVAVLTILLTPVVKQLAQTMRTNRLAKEQQYANESAEYLMEYAQKVNYSDLTALSDDDIEALGDDGTYIVSVNGCSSDSWAALSETEQKALVSRTCDVYIYDGTGGYESIDEYASTSGLQVSYTSNSYKFNTVELGSRKTKYTRTLILDDLNNKIAAYSFQDKTDVDKIDGLRVYYSSDKSEELEDGFSFTSDGSIVKYETDSNGDTYIAGIVCTLRNYADTVSDPNSTPLGSMQDLVSTQVALVNGDTTNYDDQAMNDLYAAALAYLKTNNPAEYDRAMNGTVNPLDEPGYLDSLKKTITVKIDQGKDNTGETYYLVKVDVTYKSDVSEKLEYNAFSQKFYYEENADGTIPSAPAVYIEYQPFSVDGIGYAADEYFFVENYVDNAKIYLYKAAKDLVNSTINSNDEDTLADATTVNKVSTGSDGNVSYETSEASGTRVKLHINMVKGTNDEAVSTDGKTVRIYTNIVDTDELSGVKVSSINSEQFDVTKIIATDSIYDSDSYDAFESYNPSDDDYDSSKTTLFIDDVANDTTYSQRLYTATVIVAPETAVANTVTLTGAKGGN
jgi:prepilin-type N-terminal cleavage/methylation domain-containing protein